MASDLSHQAESYLRHLVDDGVYSSVTEALDAILQNHAASELERTLGMSRDKIRDAIEKAEASGVCEDWEPYGDRIKRMKTLPDAPS